MEILKRHLINLCKLNGSLFLNDTKRLKAIIDKEYPDASKDKYLIGISLAEEIPARLGAIYSYQNLTDEPSKFIYRLKALKIQLKNKYFLGTDEIDFIEKFWTDIICFDKLIPVDNENNHYSGYKNSKGDLIVDYKFFPAYQFSEGLAFATNDWTTEKYICIDSEGNEIFSLQCEGIPPAFKPRFSDGLALMCINNKNCFLNKKGETALIIDEYKVQHFSEGLAYVVKDRKGGFINKYGELSIPLIYDDSNEITGFKDGLISLKNKVGKAGVIDTNNNIIIPFDYEYVGPFMDGIALTKRYDRYNYIDKNNNIIIPHIKDCFWAGDFNEGLAPVEINGKCGCIDKSGAFVLPPNYYFAPPIFIGGVAQVWLTESSYYTNYIDKQGNVLSGEWG